MYFSRLTFGTYTMTLRLVLVTLVSSQGQEVPVISITEAADKCSAVNELFNSGNATFFFLLVYHFITPKTNILNNNLFKMQNQLKGLNQFSTLLNYQEENPVTQPTTPALRH